MKLPPRRGIAVLLVLGATAFGAEPSLEKAFETLEKSDNAGTRLLEWVRVTDILHRLEKAKTPLDGRSADRLQALATEKVSRESLEALAALFIQDRPRRHAAIEKPEAIVPFAVAAIVQQKSVDRGPAADWKGGPIADAVPALIRLLLAPPDGALPDDAVEAMRTVVTGKGLPERPSDAFERQRRVFLALLFARPTVADTVLKPVVPHWESRLTDVLNTYTRRTGTDPLDHFLADFCRDQLAARAKKRLAELSLTTILKTVAAPEGPGGKTITDLVPAHPLVKKEDARGYLTDRSVFAVPLETASLVDGKATALAKEIESVPLNPNVLHRNTRVIRALETVPATSGMMLAMGTAKFTDLELRFKGSNDDVGVYYHRLKSVLTPADTKGITAYQLGIQTDAYTRLRGKPFEPTKTPEGLRFWVAAGFRPGPGSSWVAVRWRNDAAKAPLDDELTSDTKANILRSDPAALREDEFVKAERDPEKLFGLLDGHADRFGADPTRPGIFAFFNVRKKFRENRVSYTTPHSGPLRCAAGCTTSEPLAVEPDTQWAIFRLDPAYRDPMIFEVAASPLVIHRNPLYFNARGGYVPMAFEIAELHGNDARPRLELLPPLDVTTPAENGLLAYVESLVRHGKKDGWFRPDSARPEIDALQALVRLGQLQTLIETETAAFPAKETQPVPWRGRIAVAKSALPVLAMEISQHFGAQLERDLPLYASRTRRLERAQSALLQALEAEDKLSEDEVYALLGRTAQTLRADTKDLRRSRDEMVASLRAAQRKVRELLEGSDDALHLSCLALQRLQFAGNALLPPLRSPAEVLRLCERP